jgi:hypothetical protein
MNNLEQEMRRVLNNHDENDYSSNLAEKITKVAQIHTMEEKISIFKGLKANGMINAGNADYFIQQLETQLKQLQGG